MKHSSLYIHGMNVTSFSNSKFKFKILGSEKYIGIAIEQQSSNILIPITNYFFWPRNDAWEQIRLDIASKPCISNIEQFNILNNTSKILNDWNNSTNKKKFFQEAKLRYENTEYVGIV